MRPRFRISTLFWMTVVVAAFFCGRRSHDIESSARRWWQVTRVRWGGSVDNTEVIRWPPGSITINEPQAIQQAVNYDPKLASVAFHASNQICISPEANGDTVVSYNFAAGKYRKADFKFTINVGRIDSDWSLSRQ
jgi:hypothetical protein